MKVLSNNGVTYTIGQNAVENWSILSISRDFYWVHLDNIASAHAIIHIDVEPTKEELEFARQALLAQTKKASKSSGVVYACVKYVRRGSVPGEVYVVKNMDHYYNP